MAARGPGYLWRKPALLGAEARLADWARLGAEATVITAAFAKAAAAGICDETPAPERKQPRGGDSVEVPMRVLLPFQSSGAIEDQDNCRISGKRARNAVAVAAEAIGLPWPVASTLGSSSGIALLPRFRSR
jgi:hypothetical protein